MAQKVQYQSFSHTPAFWETSTQTGISVNLFDLAASLETAAYQAERDNLPGIAQRLRNDAELLRAHKGMGTLIMDRKV